MAILNPAGKKLKPLCVGLLDTAITAPSTYLPYVKGQVLTVLWSDLQPNSSSDQISNIVTSAQTVYATPGTYINNAPATSVQYTGVTLQQAIENCRDLGSDYYCKLRVMGGIYSPNWVKFLDGDGTSGNPGFTIIDSTTNIQGTSGRWWSPNYDTAFGQLHTQLATVYDTDPVIREVCVTRSTGVFAEPFNRSGTANNAVLLGLGGTYPFVVGSTSTANSDVYSIQRSIDQVMAAWSTTRVSIAMNPYQSIQSSSVTTNDVTTTISIGNYAYATYGTQFVAQNNSLRDPQQSAGGYSTLYNWMQTVHPIGGQTAQSPNIGSLANALTNADNLGWTHAELHTTQYEVP